MRASKSVFSMVRSIPHLSKREFLRVLKTVPTVVVEAIVKNENGILLGKRNTEPFKGLWHFTGGFVNYNEKISDAVNRVAKRETGADVEIVKFLGVYEYIHDDPRGHIIALAYLVKIAEGTVMKPSVSSFLTPDALKIAPTPDNTELKYFRSAPEDMIPYQKKIFSDAMKS